MQQRLFPSGEKAEKVFVAWFFSSLSFMALEISWNKLKLGLSQPWVFWRFHLQRPSARWESSALLPSRCRLVHLLANLVEGWIFSEELWSLLVAVVVVLCRFLVLLTKNQIAFHDHRSKNDQTRHSQFLIEEKIIKISKKRKIESGKIIDEIAIFIYFLCPRFVP